MEGANAEKITALNEAKKFVEEVLGDCEMLAKEIFKLGLEHGHSKSTIRRAAKALGVKKEQIRENKKIIGWLWSLPSATNEPSGQGGEG